MPIYHIEESRLLKFNKKIESLKKKCLKAGTYCKAQEVGIEYKEIKGTTYKFHKFDVEGIAKYNGWEFIGTIEHRPTGNIIHNVVNVDIPKMYSTTSGYCDHCKYDRPRKTTCLVRTNDEWKQLGKKCVELYTHGITAEHIASVCSVFKTLDDEERYYEEYEPITSTDVYFDVRSILNFSIEAVRNNGYVKKYDGYGVVNHNSTFNVVSNMIQFKEMCDNMEEVFDMIHWVKNHDDSNTFINNIKVIVNEGFVSLKNMGILISLVPIYNKETRRCSSDFYGRVGDKIDVDVDTGEIVGSYNSAYGRVYVYRFTNKRGYVFISKTTRYMSEVPLAIHISGTIKEHNTYKNEKQTIIERLKVKTSC